MAEETTNNLVTMVTLNAAKQTLRAAMKQKLKHVSHDSIVSQSTEPYPLVTTYECPSAKHP